MGTVVAASVPAIAAQKDQPADSELERVLAETEKGLNQPLSPEGRKLAIQDLKNLQSEREDRLKHRLPENSEPCFVFVPTGYKR